jgi:hypothetical protein
MKLLWIALALLVGCGKDKPAAPVAGSGAGTGAAVGSGSAVDSAAVLPAAGKDFVALLTAQTKPALVGPFAKLQLASDLTIAAARAQAPDLVVDANVMNALDWYEYKAETYAGVSLRTERVGQLDSLPETWLVGRLRAVIGDLGIQDKLTRAWGTPKVYGKRAHWYDPAAKLRCVLQPSDGRDTPTGTMVLDCDGYTPLAEMIGTDKTLFGFEEGTPILGMPLAAVKARWGRRVFEEGSQIMLRPTELAERVTRLQIGDKEPPEKVTWFTLSLSADQPTIEKLLEAKFGKPHEDDKINGKIYRAKAPRVVFTGSEITVGIPPE